MSEVKNSYPSLPVIAYQKTMVEMPLVIIFAKSLIGPYLKEVVKSAYMVFRVEGGNGKDGINNNYASIEGDCGQWEGLDLTHVIGTCIKFDGKQQRRHLCFDENGYKVSFDFLCYKLSQRGIYIGAPGCATIHDLAALYKQRWAGYPAGPSDFTLFSSLDHSATTVFG